MGKIGDGFGVFRVRVLMLGDDILLERTGEAGLYCFHELVVGSGSK